MLVEGALRWWGIWYFPSLCSVVGWIWFILDWWEGLNLAGAWVVRMCWGFSLLGFEFVIWVFPELSKLGIGGRIVNLCGSWTDFLTNSMLPRLENTDLFTFQSRHKRISRKKYCTSELVQETGNLLNLWEMPNLNPLSASGRRLCY